MRSQSRASAVQWAARPVKAQSPAAGRRLAATQDGTPLDCGHDQLTDEEFEMRLWPVVVVSALVAGGWMMAGRGLNMTSPVLKGQEAYVGTWRGPGVELKITPSARLWYDRKESADRGAEQAINFPISEISPSAIVGKGGAVRLEVSEPPHQSEGRWLMKVEGAALVKE